MAVVRRDVAEEDVAARGRAAARGRPLAAQSPAARQALLNIQSAEDERAELALPLVDQREPDLQPEVFEVLVGARRVDRLRHRVGRVLVGGDDLHEVEREVERGDGAQEEDFARRRVEVVIDRADERLAREDRLGVAAVAHLDDDVLGAGQNLGVREPREAERAAGEHVARERRVGARAGQGDVVALRVLKVHLDARELARVGGEAGVAVLGLEVAEEEVGAAAVEPRVEFRVGLRVLEARRGVAEERVGAVERVELEEAVAARRPVDGTVAVVGERQQVLPAEELPAVEEGEAAAHRGVRLGAGEFGRGRAEGHLA